MARLSLLVDIALRSDNGKQCSVVDIALKSQLIQNGRPSSSLTHKCAKFIGKNVIKEVLEALVDVIPEELHRMCLMYHDDEW